MSHLDCARLGCRTQHRQLSAQPGPACPTQPSPAREAARFTDDTLSKDIRQRCTSEALIMEQIVVYTITVHLDQPQCRETLFDDVLLYNDVHSLSRPFMCIYIYIYIYTHYIYIHTYIIHLSLSTCIYIYMYISISLSLYIYICIYIYIYIYTYYERSFGLRRGEEEGNSPSKSAFGRVRRRIYIYIYI